MQNAKIVVVGLGAMGSAALYHLARRGVAAVGIEQFELGHALGSSHGFSRIFRDIYEHPEYIKLAEATIPMWEELDSRAAEKLMHFTGLLYFARPGNENIAKRIEAMGSLGRQVECLSPQEVTARYPALRLPPDAVTCFTARAGLLNVGRCILEHLDQAQRAGATVQERVRVHGVDISQETPLLETSAGPIGCDRLIISPGPWAPEILEELALPLRVTRQQEFYFLPRDRAPYQPGRLPVFGDMDTKFYGFPDYGPGVKTADDGLGDETSASEVDRTLDFVKRDELQAWLSSIMPDGGFSYVEGTTCMYTSTPDRDFVIGVHPGNANVLFAAGFSGHGFKFSTLVGKILADLAAEGSTEYSLERFRPDRFDKDSAS